MRILYASERPPYPFFLGGAARCAHQLLLTMTRNLSAECAAVGSSDYAVSPWSYPQPAEYQALDVKTARLEEQDGMIDCGYPVHVIPDFFHALGDFIDAFRPDVVWAQLEGARGVLELAHRKEVQGLYYVHDAEFDLAELRAIADLDCHIVCGSGFLAEKVRRVIGRPAHVAYPASEWYFGTHADSNGYVTMINPHRVKGVETFFEIAKRLPAEKFLLVESWKLNDTALAALQERLAQLPNISFSRRVSDMRTIYGQTKLLLAPSMWEEGFGMVAVEAQSCGIPVIASERGGLPESVGDGGIMIEDYLNVAEWLNAINMVLGDKAAYQAWAGRALGNAQSADFSPIELARRFLVVCAAKAPRTAFYTHWLRAALNQIERVPLLGKILCQARR